MNDICVSIVMPAYNSENYIADTIQSIQDQSHHNWELIICDDASKDRTRSIVQTFMQKDKRIRLICHDNNRGVAAARNHCLQQAKGAYICFIDADDLWPPDKISYQLAAMLANRQAITCGHFVDIDAAHKDRSGCLRRCRRQITLPYLLKNNCVLFQTVMAEASCRPHLQFKPVRHEDFVLAIDLLRAGYRIQGLDKVLAYRLRHEGSLSANKGQSAMWRIRIYRDYLHLNGLQTTYYTACYAIYAILFRLGAERRRLWS